MTTPPRPGAYALAQFDPVIAKSIRKWERQSNSPPNTAVDAAGQDPSASISRSTRPPSGSAAIASPQTTGPAHDRIA